MASEESTLPAAAATDSTGSSAADAAKARREARKAKILASGSDRLARITKTGRGSEAEALYPTSPPPPLSSSAAMRSADEDPDEIDISRIQRGRPGETSDEELQALMMQSIMRQQGAMAGTPAEGMDAGMQDPLQQMMAAMQGGGGGGLPFDLSALMGGGGPGGEGAAGMPPNLAAMFGNGAAPPKARTKFDKFFDLLHLIVMLVLGFITVSAVFSSQIQLESTVVETTLDGQTEETKQILLDEHSGLQRWARLGYERPGDWEAHFFTIADHLPFQKVVRSVPRWRFQRLTNLLLSSQSFGCSCRSRSYCRAPASWRSM